MRDFISAGDANTTCQAGALPDCRGTSEMSMLEKCRISRSCAQALADADGTRRAQRDLLDEPGEDEQNDPRRSRPSEHALDRVGYRVEHVVPDRGGQPVDRDRVEAPARARSTPTRASK